MRRRSSVRPARSGRARIVKVVGALLLLVWLIVLQTGLSGDVASLFGLLSER